MKIKSIVLEAFRVYDKQVRFNFTTSEDKIANLIVLYGPNGFGKTSFTDAIEWAFTGSISRISGNDKVVNALDNDKKNTDEQIYILKNRSSKLKQGSMKIITDSNEELMLKTRKLDGRMKTDYDPRNTNNKNREITGNVSFFNGISPEQFKVNNLITSDSINSFLQFDDPENRYEILSKFWDKDGDSKIYENIKIIYEKLLEKKQKVVNEIVEKENKIIEILRKNLDYSSLNDIITKFNLANSTKLSLINEDVNVSSFEDFKKNFFAVRQELEAKELEISSIKETCDDLIARFNLYKEKLEENIRIKANKNLNNKYLLEFRRVHNLLNDFKKVVSKIEQEKSNKNKYDTLLINKKNYEEIICKSKSLQTQKKQLLAKKDEILGKIKYNTNIMNEENKRLKDYNSSISQYNSFYVKLNNDLNLIRFNGKKIEKVNEIKVQSSMRLSRYKEKISWYENQNKELKSYLAITVDDLNRNELQFTISNIYIKDIVEDVKSLHNQYLENKHNLEALIGEKDIIEKIFKKNERILELGLSIVDESKSSCCPLCQTHFNNTNKLLDAIRGNLHFKGDFDKKNNEIKQANNIMERISKSFKELILQLKINIEKRIDKNNQVLLNLKINKQRVKENVKILNTKLNKFNLTQVELMEFLMKLETFLQKKLDEDLVYDILNEMSTSISNINDQIKKQETQIKQLETLIEESKKDIVAIDADINIIDNQIKLYENEYIYILITNLLKELNITFDKSIILGKIIHSNAEIHLLNAQRIRITSEINNITISLKDKDKDLLIENNFQIENQFKDNMQVITEYENKFNKIIDNNGIDVNKINNKIKGIIEEIRTININKNYLNKIFIYFEIFDLNSTRVSLENDIVTLTKQKERMELRLSQVRSLKDKVETYLEERIQKAFNLETINFIYKRIDPHPEFSEITFVPDFKDKMKPKMYIHAVNQEDELSPVLYFSAAQVSILSLSIFLAKSLLEDNSIDAIFMDDPVQHLDSINVLSFIDLIRSIITNPKINKQVVITTNNDTFYKLLKLKLDEEYYDSKFLELKSYGVLGEVE